MPRGLPRQATSGERPDSAGSNRVTFGRPVARAADGSRYISAARRLTLIMLAAAILWCLAGIAGIQVFRVPTDSMQPTLQAGDRILVLRAWWAGELARGDVVVFDGRGSFLPGTPRTGLVAGQVLPFTSPGEAFYVKRVIGLPGDRVACCDDSGRLMVNGRAVAEPYLYPGDSASEDPFDVEVPSARLWVMGDHRSASTDSRAFLGRAGGGFVPRAGVVGRVIAVGYPPSRAGNLPDASAKVSTVSGTEPIGSTR